MDFISNFNGLEFFFILVLALIIFGPERLPAIGAKLGEYTRTLRQISSQIMAQWRQEVGLDETVDQGKGFAAELRSTSEEIKKSIRPVEKTIAAAAKPSLKTINDAVQGTASDQEEGPPTEAKREAEGAREQVLSQRVQDLEEQLNSLKSELARLEEEDNG